MKGYGNYGNTTRYKWMKRYDNYGNTTRFYRKVILGLIKTMKQMIIEKFSNDGGT